MSMDISTSSLDKIRNNTDESTLSGDLLATPTLGVELYPGKKYYRVIGFMDNASMKVAMDRLELTTGSIK